MNSPVLLLDRIRSMHNVGSIFRTCDGAGVSKLVITGYTATPPRKEISKTALDADQVVPWEYISDPLEAISRLRDEGYTIVAVEKNASSKDMREVSFLEKENVCFILGNEVDGVSDMILDVVDHTIHLPMLGLKESLNVSVCAGALLYYYL